MSTSRPPRAPRWAANAAIVVALLAFVVLAVGLGGPRRGGGEEAGPVATTEPSDLPTEPSAGHQHLTMDDPPRPTRPLTRAERAERSVQLAAARSAVPGPTLGAAEAAGWRQMASSDHIYRPGVALDRFDPATPPMLLLGHGDQVVALVYWVEAGPDDPPPAGFAGPEDQWHYHGTACRFGNRMEPWEDRPLEACTADGGSVATKGGYMLHVWAIPAHPNPRGLFAPAD